MNGKFVKVFVNEKRLRRSVVDMGFVVVAGSSANRHARFGVTVVHKVKLGILKSPKGSALRLSRGPKSS